jgi:L-alanine-DL-glutamate epimerase-like enolase superfamily enzyme
VTDPLAPVNGEIRVPTGPGLGVELDPAAIERFRIDR